jgi:hypothetical protein
MRRTTNNQHLGACMLALCAVAMATDPAIAAPPQGAYRYAEGRVGKQRLQREIARVADEMNFLIRGIVRSRLRGSNPIAAHITVATDGQIVALRYDKRVYRARLGAPPAKVVGTTGDKLDHTVRRVGDVLVERFVGPDGTRVNRLKPAGPDKLVLDVTITSDRLPSDVRYHLVYRRAKGS